MIKRTGDHSWFEGRSRTWRWNEGTYEQRGSYDAVEAGPEGLRWYHWNHAHGDGGAQSQEHQSYAAFADTGPRREIPDALCAQLRQWIAERSQ